MDHQLTRRLRRLYVFDRHCTCTFYASYNGKVPRAGPSTLPNVYRPPTASSASSARDRASQPPPPWERLSGTGMVVAQSGENGKSEGEQARERGEASAGLALDEEAKLVYGVVFSLRNMVKKLAGRYILFLSWRRRLADGRRLQRRRLVPLLLDLRLQAPLPPHLDLHPLRPRHLPHGRVPSVRAAADLLGRVHRVCRAESDDRARLACERKRDRQRRIQDGGGEAAAEPLSARVGWSCECINAACGLGGCEDVFEVMSSLLLLLLPRQLLPLLQPLRLLPRLPPRTPPSICTHELHQLPAPQPTTRPTHPHPCNALTIFGVIATVIPIRTGRRSVL